MLPVLANPMASYNFHTEFLPAVSNTVLNSVISNSRNQACISFHSSTKIRLDEIQLQRVNKGMSQIYQSFETIISARQPKFCRKIIAESIFNEIFENCSQKCQLQSKLSFGQDSIISEQKYGGLEH